MKESTKKVKAKEIAIQNQKSNLEITSKNKKEVLNSRSEAVFSQDAKGTKNGGKVLGSVDHF